MGKIKLFIENFLIYGIGGAISKIIPFVMLPLITRLMPDSTFIGLYDLSNTVIEFGRALAIFGMYDAMFRMFFEKEDANFRVKICSTAFFTTLLNSIIIFGMIVLFRRQIALYFLGDIQYVYLIEIAALAVLIGATNGIVSAPTRMLNKRKVFLVTNTVGPMISYLISIPLILRGHFVIALSIGALVSSIVLEIIFWILNREWFRFGEFDIELFKIMLFIAAPIVPSFLVYWIFGSCDRIMITNQLGIAAAGIYSVGGKIGQISQLIYIAFAGGWQFFAFSTMKEKTQVKSNSLIYEYLGVISFNIGIFMCAFSNFIFGILFEDEYIEGYLVAPYLFLAPLLQMLEQVAANQFLIVKKTWPSAFILSFGAVSNIVLNYFLIPVLGIEGAAISTVLGYLIANIIVIIVLRKMGLFILSRRFVFVFILMCVYFVGWRIWFKENTWIGVMVAFIVLLSCMKIYKSDLLSVIQNGKRRDKISNNMN